MEYRAMISRLKIAYRRNRERIESEEILSIYFDAGKDLDIPYEILRRSLAPSHSEKVAKFHAEIDSKLSGMIWFSLLIILVACLR